MHVTNHIARGENKWYTIVFSVKNRFCFNVIDGHLGSTFQNVSAHDTQLTHVIVVCSAISYDYNLSLGFVEKWLNSAMFVYNHVQAILQPLLQLVQDI